MKNWCDSVRTTLGSQNLHGAKLTVHCTPYTDDVVMAFRLIVNEG